MRYLEDDGNIHLGCYYTNAQGEIFYFYGSGPKGIMGRDINDRQVVVGGHGLLQDFKRIDVMDFPQPVNPRLAYEFDNYFDLKHVSDIAYLSIEHWGELNQLLRQHYGCELAGTSPEDLEQLSAVVRERNDLRNGYLQPDSIPPKPSFDHWEPGNP